MKKRFGKTLLALWAALALVLGVNMGTVPASAGEAGTMAVHFIDVGQGLAVLVQSGGENLLYDGGPREHGEDVVQYLKNQQVEKLDYMISSHYDEDHLAGLIDCMNAFEVETAIGADYVHTSDLYQNFMNTATSQAITIQYPKPGDEFAFGTGSFTVEAPDGISSSNSNDNSVAIRLVNGSNSFLLTGDAEETSEQDMISSGRNLDCDVLCLGHHGSASSTSWDLLEASTPSWAVISCGAGNSYGHPAAETMDKLSSMGIPVYRTDKQGTVIAVSDGSTITWNQDPCNDYSDGSASAAGGSSAAGSSSVGNATASGASASAASSAAAASTTGSSGTDSSTDSSSADQAPQTEQTADPQGATVWLSATGSKYHSRPDCGNMNPVNARQISRSDAEAQGYEACKKCF